MSRAVGEFDLVALVPDVLTVFFAVITQLADTWFVFGVLALFYWLASTRWADHPRRVGVTLIALATCGIAAVTFFKILIGVPRPPPAAVPADVPVWMPALVEHWYADVTMADGFGFPSGHAVGATVMYGGFAILLDRWRKRDRLIVATVLIVLISLSRIVIEVHYLVDIVVGVLLGGLVLWSVLNLAGFPGRLDPVPGFAIAAVLSGAAVASAFTLGHIPQATEATMGVGTALGAIAGWHACTGEEPPLSGPQAGVTLLFTGGLWIGSYVLAPPLVVILLATFLATTIVIAAPAIASNGFSTLSPVESV